jgi:hypothetical protein
MLLNNSPCLALLTRHFVRPVLPACCQAVRGINGDGLDGSKADLERSAPAQNGGQQIEEEAFARAQGRCPTLGQKAGRSRPSLVDNMRAASKKKKAARKKKARKR